MGSVRTDRLDHLVLTVADIDATVEVYSRVLGQHLPLTPARPVITCKG